ncbi:MAG: cytochrome c-type biogenesis CcmF C-terminal domain-containing protein, partial [Fimbriimonadales bacterium]
MSVPMIQSLANRPAKVVEEGLYHQVLGWFFVPLFLLLAIGPYLSYRGRPWKDVIARAMNTASIAFALTGVSVFVLRLPTFAGEIDPTATVAFPFGIRLPLLPWMAFLIWLCLVAVLGNVWRLIEVGKAVKVTGGGLLAHVGLAILLLGLVVSRGLERKADLRVQEGRPAAALEYVVNYADIPVADEEYWNRLFDKHNKIRFHVIGEPVGDEARIRPGQRFNHAGYTIEYVRPFRTGEPGMTGTRFGAVLRVGKGERLREIQTSVELGSERLIQHTAMVDGTTVLVPLRLDAATQELAYRLFRGFEARPGHYLTIASDGRTNPMVWPHIQRFPGHDFYFTLHPQVLEASDPVRLQPGETKEVGGFQVTYRGLETSGTMGSTGASFVANLKVSDGSQSVEAKPTLQLTPAGLEPTFAPLNQDFMIRMTGMDAATKAVDVQVYFTKPVYPIEVFIKPWTGLVWLGTGILTAGGLWAAWSRRARRREQTESEP